MKKVLLLSCVLALLLMGVIMPHESQAVPSFARQIQKPCTACHTIWPNLNQYGRQFKVKAYTDVSPDWQMITKDRLNLLYVFPVSARAIFFPYTKEQNGVEGINTNSTSLDSVALFIGSRVFDYAGVFGSAEWSHDDDNFHLPTLKIAFQYPLGGGTSTSESGTVSQGSTIGLVAFKGLSSAADPFNSLGGRDRSLTWGDESLPMILTKGWTFNFSDEGNVGLVAHGYFLGNRLYAAVGALRGGRSEDVSGGNLLNADAGTGVAENDPFDGYFRLAWDQKLPNGAVTFGGAYYSGTQRVISSSSSISTPFDSNVRRAYIDASLEQNFEEDHLFELQALYGYGKEKNVFGGGEERKFDGFFVEGSYFYQRTVGLVAAFNNINVKNVSASDITGDQRKGNAWLISLNYLPWLNTKIALQYVNTKTKFAGGEPDQTDKIFRVVLDVVF